MRDRCEVQMRAEPTCVRRRVGALPFGRLALPPLLLCLSLGLAVGSARAESATPAVSAAPPAAIADPLVEFLDVPDRWVASTEAEATDAALAEAARQGPRPDLEHRSNFRKRSVDLFRAERELKILDKEMRLRLRLRAKQREALRLELKF